MMSSTKKLFMSFSLLFVTTIFSGAQPYFAPTSPKQGYEGHGKATKGTSTVSADVKKSQVQIRTIPEAIVHLRKAESNFPTDVAMVSAYEKEQSDIIVKSAKGLYDKARTQLLDALAEIDKRIAYWQYQKDHPWNYFVSKNPMKWVTGPKQEDEIENNLETLKSYQGELYVRLGQLSELGDAFNRGYKDTFLTDYKKGYEWADKVLDALVSIKVTEEATSKNAFIARVQRIVAQLKHVTKFKDDLLSDISGTEIPSSIARNWVKGSATIALLGYGYTNLYDPIKNSLGVVQQGAVTLLKPWEETAEALFYPKSNKDANASQLQGLVKYETEQSAKFVHDMSAKYKIKQKIEEDVLGNLEKGNIVPFRKFVDVVYKLEKESLEKGQTVENIEKVIPKEGVFTRKAKEWIPERLNEAIESTEELIGRGKKLVDYGYGFSLYGALSSSLGVESVEQRAAAKIAEFAAIQKVILLIPAALVAGAAYTGYQTLTTKNYSPLRRALLDINSLFVDASKPLTDEQLGKMMYLVDALKKRAIKELPIKKNLRADFIHDLEKIESSEFNVAAKRAIVEDMFKKYAFLGFVL